MDARINVDSFCSYYMFHPFSQNLSFLDQIIVTLSTAILGVMTLGTAHIICRLFYYNRNFSMLPSPPSTEKTIPDPLPKKSERVIVVAPLPFPSSEIPHSVVPFSTSRLSTSQTFTVEIVVPSNAPKILLPPSVLQRMQQAFHSLFCEEESGLNTYFTLSCMGMTLFAPKAFVLGMLAQIGLSYYRNQRLALMQEERVVTILPTTLAIVGATAAGVQCTAAGRAAGLVGRIIIRILPVIGGACAGRVLMRIRSWIGYGNVNQGRAPF